MAEEEGFEPPRSFDPHDFESTDLMLTIVNNIWI